MEQELNFKVCAPEVEAMVLGTLLGVQGSLGDALPLLKGEMFYDQRNREVFAAVLEVDGAGTVVDMISVGEALRKSGRLEGVGGYAYLSELTEHVGLSERLPFYVRVLADKFVQRELVKFGGRVMQLARSGEEDLADVLARVEGELEGIVNVTTCGERMAHVGRLTELSVAAMADRVKSYKEGRVFGVTTGLEGLDRLLTGLHGGELVILAGRPGSGKTSVMLGMVKAAAAAGCPVCVFSLEMTGVSLADRLLLSEGSVAAKDFRRGSLGKEDYREVSLAQGVLAGMPIYIDDSSGVSMQYIRGVARMMYKRGVCGAVFIDYLQLMTSKGDRKYNREQEVAQISGQAKALAKELGVPVVLLSQLNRDCEKRADKKPELSDLRESGAIEQDADVVVLVYRPEYYGMRTMDGMPIKNVGKLIVAKHRDGAVGEVKFGYNESLTRVWDYVEKMLF